jgi:thymidylate kinase
LRGALPKGVVTRIQLSLPDTNLYLDVEAEVVWADIKGRAGLRFHNVEKSTQERLEKWLDERLEEEIPGAKQRIAAAESERLQ